MADLGPVPWPPEPLRTERLRLREPENRDRATYVELLSSPEVHAHVGRARSREELEQGLPRVPERWPGSFTVTLDGQMIGQVLLRRATEHELPEAVGRAGLGFLFLPSVWGQGYAGEACAAVLDWFDATVPDEPVVLTTRAANAPALRLADKLGFAELGTFEAAGAEHWVGLRPAAAAGR